MSRNRKKIIIIILAVLIVVALFLWWLLSRRTPIEPPPSNNTASTTQDLTLRQLEQLPPPSPQVILAEKSYPLGLKQLAMSYAERYGTYSNDSNFKSLEDLRSLSTSKMQKYIDSIIARGSSSVTTYDGYSAKALSSDLLKYNDTAGMAEISVKTQRFHYLGDASPVVSYQSLLLKFIKDGEDWKVDEAKWQ